MCTFYNQQIFIETVLATIHKEKIIVKFFKKSQKIYA